MLGEDNVPLWDRYLLIDGAVSSTAIEVVRAGLPNEWPGTARCVFVSYAYADLPLGACFEFVFPKLHPTRGEPTLAIIHAVTQQFAKPFDSIPHGWKTICVFDFPRGVPAVIDGLPAVRGWGETSERIALCSRDTMEAILKRRR